MERDCLGDSCLVKCDGETMRHRERERDEIKGGRRGRWEDGVNHNSNIKKQTS